ncbi:MAG TPA: ABC transporter permease, partial [Bacillota bacterium]|nr:ABC transporter permease [Bacillota bacterium]
MGIIIKFIFRNIKEKKFRTFLIVFSVMLSTALFFASLALSGTIEKTFLERIKKYIGNADIIIHANEKSPFWLFRLAKTAAVEQQLDYAVGSIETSATYRTLKETFNIDLKGYFLDDLARLSPYALAEQTELLPFTGHKIIFSQKTAEKYHLKPGADVELQIDDNRYRFKIVGIAQPSGLFQDD